jgi:HAD superfamily hydrolase (TIGR01509 family)
LLSNGVRETILEVTQRIRTSDLRERKSYPMLMLRRPRLLIFDCDGVLINSQVIQCRKFIGVATKDMEAYVERAIGQTLPANFEEERDRLVDAAYRLELQAMAGVREAILKIGIPSCVASNAQTKRVCEVLELTGLLPIFAPNVFGADLVARPKPAPDLFLFAANSMEVEPAECLVIEDSAAGVRAAVSAGMPVVGYHGGSHCFDGYEGDLRVAGALMSFREMSELQGYISMLSDSR